MLEVFLQSFVRIAGREDQHCRLKVLLQSIA